VCRGAKKPLTEIINTVIITRNPSNGGHRRVMDSPRNQIMTHRTICWLCLTILTAVGLKYVPGYLVEQRKLDMQDRVIDMRERAFLQTSAAPTVSVPAPVQVHSDAQWL
jgi:hypothetical protein